MAEDLETRIEAIAGLGRSASRDSAAALLEVGARDTEGRDVLRAVGSALATLAHSGVTITEFDMRDLQGVAYDEFCDWRA
jgi:hypothetical protein